LLNTPEIERLLLREEENNPIIGAGLSTLLLVQNTTEFGICNTSLELHQYSKPDPTSYLTYHPNTTPYTNPQNPSIQAVCIKLFKRLTPFH